MTAYDTKLCGPIWRLLPRNRDAGPFGLLNMVDERCGGILDNIDAVIPAKERAEFIAGYKTAAGFAIETLNKAPPIIPNGARAHRTSQNKIMILSEPSSAPQLNLYAQLKNKSIITMATLPRSHPEDQPTVQ